MAELNIGNLQPLTEEKFLEELDSLEEDKRKEKIISLIKERNSILEANHALFARAKKAEGFEQDKDGNWIKVVEKDSKDNEKSPKPKKVVEPNNELLERLENLALQVAGIKEQDEVELFNKWKADTGRSAEEIIGNSIFQKELAELRIAKENQKATSDIQGGGQESALTKDPDYWISKATKDAQGNLLFPDEMPEEMYTKVVERLASKEPGSQEGIKFYDQK